MNSSLSHLINDEIALEGLDGITLDALWIRLKNRDEFIEKHTGKRCLPNLTDSVKDKIFKFILVNLERKYIQFFILEDARSSLELFDRSQCFKPSSGSIFYPENFPRNIYNPIVPISSDDIRGSCSQFYTRQNCSDEILEKCKTLDDLKKLYSNLNRLVLVADQKQRAIALLGEKEWEKYSEFRIESYCVLEYVGRNRAIGYINSSIEAMDYPVVTEKKTYYYDKNFLVEKGYVLQYPVSYVEPSKCRCTGSLLFLTRFKPKYITPVDKNLLACGTYFHEKNTNEIEVDDLKNVFISNFDKLPSDASKITKKDLIKILNRFPQAFSLDKTNKKIKCTLPLFRPSHHTDFHSYTTSNSENTIKNEDDDFEEESIDSSIIKENCEIFKQTRIDCKILKKDFSNRICKVIESYKDRGCSKQQLSRHTDLPINLIRGVVRLLLENKFIIQKVHLINRNNTHVYIAKKYENVQVSEERKYYQEIMGELVSEESCKRIKFILDFFKEKKFLDDLVELNRSIRSWENENNISIVIDQRTIFGILKKLHQKNLIFIRVYGFNWKNITKKLTVYASESNMFDSNKLVDKIDGKFLVIDLVQHSLLKFKFINFQQYDVNFGEIQINISNDLNENIKNETEDMTEIDDNSANIQKFPSFSTKIVNKSFYGKKISKMECLFTFYRFIHYLLVPQDYSSNYSNEIQNWFEFIPRLYHIFPERSCQLLDVMLYMPIHMIRSLSNIQYDVSELYEYWNDPHKKYLTLHRVPPSVRAFLLQNRKAQFKFCELLELGSYMGLFTVHRIRQIQSAETILFTLNQSINLPNSLILNGPIEYKFEKIEDFNHFVYDIEKHLDSDNCVDEQNKCSIFPDIKIHTSNFTRRKISSKRSPEDLEEIRNKRLRLEKTKKKISQNENKKVKNKKNKNKTIKTEHEETFQVNKIDEKISKNSLKRKNGKHIRQAWTRSEDQFLLQCRLVTFIMEPNCPNPTNISRSLMMKLLHEKFPNSRTKEVNSMTKRMTKLFQISSIKKTLKYALSELEFLDPSSFISKHENSELAKEDKFIQIFNVVQSYKFKHTDFFLSKEERDQNKFIKKCDSIVENVPNTIEELKNDYTIIKVDEEIKDCFFKEPNNFIDIHGYVISNILLSTLISIMWRNDGKHDDENSFGNSSLKYMKTMKRALKHFPESVVTVVFRRLFMLGIVRKLRTKQQNIRSQLLNYRLSHNYSDKLREYYIPFSKDTHNETLISGDKHSSLNVWQFAETISSNVLGLSEVYEAKFNTEIPDEFFQFNSKNNDHRETSFRSLISRQFENNNTNSDEFIKEGKELNEFLIKHIKVNIEKKFIQNNNNDDEELHKKVITILNRKCKIYSSKKMQDYSQDIFNQNIKNIKTDIPSRIINIIIKKLESSGDLGIKESTLIEMIKYENEINKNMIENFFDICEEYELIFEVGICERTWVHRKYYHHWLMHYKMISNNETKSNDNQQNNEKLFVFLPKLWRSLDGKIDIKSLFSFFNLLIGHLTFNHVSKFFDLKEKFSDILPGSQLFELLHYLNILGCVKIIRVPVKILQNSKHKKKINSFDDYFSQEYDLSDEDDDEEIDDSYSEHSSNIDFTYDTFYEASLNCTSKLSDFYQTLSRENFV